MREQKSLTAGGYRYAARILAGAEAVAERAVTFAVGEGER